MPHSRHPQRVEKPPAARRCPERGGGEEPCHSPKYFGQPFSLPTACGRSPLAEGVSTPFSTIQGRPMAALAPLFQNAEDAAFAASQRVENLPLRGRCPERGGGEEPCHSPKYFGQPYTSSLPHRLRAEPPRRGGQGVSTPFSTIQGRPMAPRIVGDLSQCALSKRRRDAAFAASPACRKTSLCEGGAPKGRRERTLP